MSDDKKVEKKFDEEDFDRIKNIPAVELPREVIQEAKNYMIEQLKQIQNKKAASRLPKVPTQSSTNKSIKDIDIPDFINKKPEEIKREPSLAQEAMLKIGERLFKFLNSNIQSDVPDYEFPWKHGEEGDSIRIFNLGKLEEEQKAKKSGKNFLPNIPTRGISINDMDLHTFMLVDKGGEAKSLRVGLGKIGKKDKFSHEPIQNMNEVVERYFNDQPERFHKMGLNFGELEPRHFAIDPNGKKHYYLEKVEQEKDR